jgi:hypothetical protein
MCDRRTLLALTMATGLIVACAWAGAASAQEPEPKYLSSDLADRLAAVTQGWGDLGMDTSVKPLQQPAMKLRIKHKEYQHGLGHHASGEIVVDLSGQFQTFQAETASHATAPSRTTMHVRIQY